ncbi:Uncharacterized [Syntrophomonas zehnderi OL-4]|uniref:Uncharacterized n=1 Tax=Syntrophomonas zehnderi OL-4 TaxID=690567 RepID=A0A0E4GDG1_9FIRM|nr:hypothetical protein [Syntrophomonas zehnderi]CFX47751.1 Uncharacterized [Syntrophomonas zehnderi OL-4]
MEEKPIVIPGKRPNVNLVFTGGDGEKKAYKILADIVIKKFTEEKEKELEGEKKCE